MSSEHVVVAAKLTSRIAESDTYVLNARCPEGRTISTTQVCSKAPGAFSRLCRISASAARGLAVACVTLEKRHATTAASGIT
jgi:hypothetical protein